MNRRIVDRDSLGRIMPRFRNATCAVAISTGGISTKGDGE